MDESRVFRFDRREAAAALTMATHLAGLATQVEEHQPLSAAISTALQTAAQFARQMHSILDELPTAIARETEEARNRAANPAKGKPSVEEKNDSQENRDHV